MTVRVTRLLHLKSYGYKWALRRGPILSNVRVIPHITIFNYAYDYGYLFYIIGGDETQCYTQERLRLINQIVYHHINVDLASRVCFINYDASNS